MRTIWKSRNAFINEKHVISSEFMDGANKHKKLWNLFS